MGSGGTRRDLRRRVAFDAACRRTEGTKQASGSAGANTVRRYRATMRQTMEAAAGIEHPRNRRPVSNSDATIAHLILLAGLRPSEARGLLIEQVDRPDEGFGRIRVLRSAQDPGRFRSY